MARRRGRRMLAMLSVVVVVSGACGGGDGGDGDGDGGDTDGEALGASAQTSLLAEATVSAVPTGPLVWAAYTVSDVEHAHDPGFVHAEKPTSITIEGERRDLSEGDAVFVPAGTTHAHGSGTAWDVVLAGPGADPPAGADGTPVFRSETLEGIPDGEVTLSTLRVELPPGAETSVHTHPGSEYIYVTRGPFVYENGIVGEVEASEGDHHTLPAGTPVQKRNPPGGTTTGEFLSWFVVDPDEPFAPGARFDRGGGPYG